MSRGAAIKHKHGTATTAQFAAAEVDVDVVLMTLQFSGGMNGTEAAAAITAKKTERARVLIVTIYDTDTLPAIEAGVTGYLLKDSPPEVLAAAVRGAPPLPL